MIIKGDVNGDGRITQLDLFLIRAHLLESVPLTEKSFIAADINDDGKISISDLVFVRMHLLGQLVLNEVIE